MLKNKKAYLFDLDGTLIDSMASNFNAWAKALKHYSLTMNKEWYYQNEGRNIRKLIVGLLEKNNVKENILDDLIFLKESYFKQEYIFNPYPGVENLLKKIQSKNIKIGMVTAGLKSRVEETIPAVFLKYFDTVIAGESTIRGKPFPDPYLEALKNLNVNACDAVAVENAPLGIESAKSSELFCVAIASTLPRERLAAADVILNNIQDLDKLI